MGLSQPLQERCFQYGPVIAGQGPTYHWTDVDCWLGATIWVVVLFSGIVHLCPKEKGKYCRMTRILRLKAVFILQAKEATRPTIANHSLYQLLGVIVQMYR